MFNLIAWLVLGVITGAIAKLIYPGNQGGGFIATMFLSFSLYIAVKPGDEYAMQAVKNVQTYIRQGGVN